MSPLFAVNIKFSNISKCFVLEKLPEIIS